MRDSPRLHVMALDADELGFGASGRDGGFNMTLFGVEPEVPVLRWGKTRAREAQAYMQQAVAYVHDLVRIEGLDSDYDHTGMLRVAYTRQQEERLKSTYRLLCDLATENKYSFLNQAEVAEKLNAPQIRAAIYEPETGILDSCKHVRALKNSPRAPVQRFMKTRRLPAFTEPGMGWW